MEAAHCRIGRVRMKNGGADVRVLPSSSSGPAMDTLRRWADNIASHGYRPDAIGAAAYMWDERSGTWMEWSSWHSTHATLPPTTLPAMVEASLRESIAAVGIESRIMRKIGFEPDDAG